MAPVVNGGALFDGSVGKNNEQIKHNSGPLVTPPDLSQLYATLRAAKKALGQRDFVAAERNLRQAAGAVQGAEQEALVVRLTEISRLDQQFWQVVERQIAKFSGAEELAVGESGLMVIVVEANSNSIVIRRNGKNQRYVLNNMPIGLAMAVFNHHRDTKDPSLLLLRGAALAAATPSDPAYIAEARRVWTEAGKLGADVDDLILTLGDTYN